MPRNARVQRYRESYTSHTYAYERFDPPLKVVGAVLSRWGPGDRFHRVRRPNLSLNLVTLGSASYRQEGRTGTVVEGQAFLAHPGRGQRFETGAAGFLHKRSVIMEGAGLDPLLRSTGLSDVDVVTPSSAPALTALFRRVFRVLRDKPPGFVADLSKAAYEILLECARSVAPDYPAPVADAMRFIRQNLMRRITLGDISAQARVSTRQCNRLFNRHMGISPIAYVISQRMSTAASVLLNTTLTVKAVAAMVGYDDPFRFSLHFKQRYGVSPMHYRRTHEPTVSVPGERSVVSGETDARPGRGTRRQGRSRTARPPTSPAPGTARTG